jgi:putative transposase
VTPLVLTHQGPEIKFPVSSLPTAHASTFAYETKQYKGRGLIMPRPPLIRTKHIPYHISSRTKFGEAFPISLEVVWKIMISELRNAQIKHGLAVHAFILMTNHFHLLAHTPKENLDQVMQEFLRNVSLRVFRTIESKQLWAPRYKWCLISAYSHYLQVYRYLYQNPVRASLVQKIEDWNFSSLKEVPFAIHSHVPMSFGGNEGELLWLNKIYSEEERKLIRLGLRRFEFSLAENKRRLHN